MDRIVKYLQSRRKDVKDLLFKLIEIPTVSSPGDYYEEIVNLLEKECRKTGLKTRRYRTPRHVLAREGVKGGSPRVSLVADWPSGAKRTLHMNGHYDVVPAVRPLCLEARHSASRGVEQGAVSGWKTHPFKPVFKDGKIFGRGAEDMKGWIASTIFSLRALQDLKIKPACNVQLSFTPDEELGGVTGLGYLVEKGLVKADAAIGEGFSKDFVSLGNRGVLWIKVEVLGKAAHASKPYMGRNTACKMAELIQELEKLNRRFQRRKTKFAVRDIRDRTPSMVIGGVLKGGNKVNVVPDRASFSIDRRVLPEEDVHAVEKEIYDVLRGVEKRDKKFRIKAATVLKDNAVVTSEDEKICKAFSFALKEVTKKKAVFAVLPARTDLCFFLNKGIPALGYGPCGRERWHADNEFVYLKSLLQSAAVFSHLIAAYE